MSYVADDPYSERARGTAYDNPDLVGGYWRPAYSQDAVVWAASQLPVDAVIVELGAGDGTLTRGLAQHCRALVATDASPNMANLLGSRLRGRPNVAVGNAAAERIPLADRSADAAVAAQAVQFFRSRETAESVRRVVRPGGRFAAIWHIADRSHQWVNELWEIFGNKLNGDHLAGTQRELATVFPHESMVMFGNAQHMRPADMLSLSHTGDRWGLATPEQREASDAAVLDVYRRYPEHQTATLPYHTAVWVFSDQPLPQPRSPDLLSPAAAERALRAYTHSSEPGNRTLFCGEGALRGRATSTRDAPRRTAGRGDRSASRTGRNTRGHDRSTRSPGKREPDVGT